MPGGPRGELFTKKDPDGPYRAGTEGRNKSTLTRTNPAKIREYVRLRAEGLNKTAAAREVGISKPTAYAIENLMSQKRQEDNQRRNRVIGDSKGELPHASISTRTMATGRAGHGNPWGNGYATLLGDEDLPGPLHWDELSDVAREALEDFALFRRRYFGRGPSPWQVDAAVRICELLGSAQTSRDREYVVLNAPPGAGKSTLWHDVIVWLICRDRGVRVLVGSRTTGQAMKYTRRIRRSLMQRDLLYPDERDLAAGLAVVPEGVLVEDFGRFKPQGRSDGDVWQMGGFTVSQPGDVLTAEKEPTVTAFGFDADYMGMRVDLAVWDDLVDPANVRTIEVIEKLQEDWDNVAEARIDPGGVNVLQGQRIRHNDLYRYCVSADAITLTGRGAVAMRDVCAGDRVLTRDGYREVEWSGGTGWKPTVTIETESGLSLALTGDHEVSTPSGWVRADALTPGSDLHIVGPALPFAAQVAGSTGGIAARPAMPVSLAVDVGVLNGIGVPSAAMVAFGEPTDALASPHVPSVILADQMLGSNAGRIVTQVRRFVAVGDGGAVEQVVTDNHPRDQLLAGERPMGGSAVTGVVLAALPDHALADHPGSLSEPFVAEYLPGADVEAGLASLPARPEGLPAVDTVRSITHTDTIEVWDLTVKKTHEFYANGILVHNCLDKRRATEEDEEEGPDTEFVPKYRHILYPSHFEDRCRGLHKRTDVAADPSRSAGDDNPGCLLDPRRIPWRDIKTLASEQPDVYRVVWQQEDLDPGEALIQKVWVDGGKDPVTGTLFLGCWDHDRPMWKLPPPAAIPAPNHLAVAVDPSPSNWWACQLWLLNQHSERRYLLALERRRMTAPEFLDWDSDQGIFTGFLEEWWQRSNDMGMAFHYVVLEVNAAQKWLLQYDHARRWAQKRSVNFVPHTTTVMKTDKDRGIPSVKGHWRSGRIRLPGAPDGSMQASMRLVNEMLRHPHGMTDDQVLAHWFFEFTVPKLAPARVIAQPSSRRPSWMRSWRGALAG